MNILEMRNDAGSLTATLQIEPGEFAAVLQIVYEQNAAQYPVPDYEDGKAPREALTARYGDDIFVGDALSLAVPEFFRRFTLEQGFEKIYQPLIKDIQGPDQNGVIFRVEAAIYPKVTLGEYKGVHVKKQENFEEAALDAAASQISVQIPAAMVARKIDALEADEKLRVCQDPIYTLLADYTKILDETYRFYGMGRPMVQVRADALDILLMSTSSEGGEPNMERFLSEMRQNVARFHDLPDTYESDVMEIIERRRRTKEQQLPEERAEEIFLSYLGTIGMNKEDWQNTHRREAAALVRRDLLLDAVAVTEQLGAAPEDLERAYADIASRAQMDIESVKLAVPADTLTWQISRDKARALIIEHAIAEE